MNSTPSQDKCRPAVAILQSKLQEENFTYQDLTHLCQEFPDCSDELHTHYAWWEELEVLEVPEPSDGLRKNFQLLLNETKYEASQEKPKLGIQKVLPALAWRWSALAATFVIGMLLGGLFLSKQMGAYSGEIKAEIAPATNSAWVMLTSNSAMDRLQALQYTKQSQELDERIIEILNQILLEDENVNVRLSALETMIFFADNAQVKEYLIRAIPYQTSPIIQWTLAEAALSIDNERAMPKIQELLQQKQVELEVRMKLEDRLKIEL